MNEEWRSRAACKGLDDLMFECFTPDEVGRALKVCDGCAVVEECHAWVMSDTPRRRDFGEAHAVVGGLTPAQLVRRLRPSRVRMPKADKVCVMCHKAFPPRSANQKTCGKTCQYFRELALNARYGNARVEESA